MTSVYELEIVSANQEDRVNNLKSYWNNLVASNQDPIPFWYKDVGTQRTLYFNLSSKGQVFPFVEAIGPNLATADLLLYH
jgi:hypothetical protein